jgi:hypothetical protein
MDRPRDRPSDVLKLRSRVARVATLLANQARASLFGLKHALAKPMLVLISSLANDQWWPILAPLQFSRGSRAKIISRNNSVVSVVYIEKTTKRLHFHNI